MNLNFEKQIPILVEVEIKLIVNNRLIFAAERN